MSTKLTVPIAAKNLLEAKEQIKIAESAGAEMIELRVDYLKNLSTLLIKNLIEIVKKISLNLPIIVTCRSKREGGAIKYPDPLRVEVLAESLKDGVDFIDFEYEDFFCIENQEKIRVALSKSSKARLILSIHNFETKFNSIGKLYRRILTVYPAAIPKLVYRSHHSMKQVNDCFDALDLLYRSSDERIGLCMGESGLITRIIAKKLGCFATFASIDEARSTAPGQVTVQQFKTVYRWDSIDSKTELFGVIGSPVAHSASPAVFNACFAKAGMNKLYLPLLVKGRREGFNDFIDNIFKWSWLDFRGFSVTIPHKRNALDYVKSAGGLIEPLTERISAVNTLVVGKDRKLSAYNTDYAGALDAITDALDIERKELKNWPVSVIGAGGVARAIVAGLSDIGARVKIYNRTVEKAKRLAGEFDCEFAGLDDLPDLDTKLLINCTSIGMHPDIDNTPVPKEYLKEDMTVFDTVYNPAETRLLKETRQVGAKTIDGLSMFVNQAAQQYKLFTNNEPDKELISNILKEKLNQMCA
jgi:3-dehydroquinate dehydratase/shikimate dehydrogenase